MSLSPIKSRLPLHTVLAHYGLSPLPNDRLRCPFHEDTTPSMQLYFETETAYCFSSQCPTHGKSIDVIDFVMYMEKCSKGEAIAKARVLAGQAAPPAWGKAAVIAACEAYFRVGLTASAEAQAYLSERGLSAASGAGFNPGTLAKDHLEWVAGAVSAGLLKVQGIGHQVFARGCRVI